MERFVCKKSGSLGINKRQIAPGESFDVLRNIHNECVLITSGNEPNIITTERNLRELGALTGTPALGGI